MAPIQVDYNRVDGRGFIRALLRGSAAWDEGPLAIHEGDLVLVEDAEGTRCKAHVREIHRYAPEDKAVAFLSLIPGKVEPNTRYDWISDDLDQDTAAG